MAYYGADVVDVNGNRIDDIRPKELITEAVQKKQIRMLIMLNTIMTMMVMLTAYM